MIKDILFIDDSRIEFELFNEAAQLSGYQGKMRCITDPRSVFVDLYEHKPLPDLIMVDIRMPHVNGFDVVRKIKKHPQYNHIFTVMFSSSDLNVDRKKALICGANYFFNKPDVFTEYPLLVSYMLGMAQENRISA